MKILESQPRRYDRGIALISLGVSERTKQKLVEDNVLRNSHVLEIGCGTGTMSIMAVQKGANVSGFDISVAMLDIAREKIAAENLKGRIELMEMGISGMDKFPDGEYDLVMSMLVFSELSLDEQRYALRHSYRILKPGGKFAVADETKPRTFLKKITYTLIRIPMLLITFALTQTTTNAVENLADLVKRAGFKIENEERNHLDSFIYITAIKEKDE